LRLDNKVEINYDYLVIASGAKANTLPIELAPIESQNLLRDYNDIKKIKDKLLDKKHITIIGGGYIGLELASSLRKADFEVNIIEMSERILQRVASKELSNFFTSLHEENGVKIFCNEKLEKIKPLGSTFEINTSKNKFTTNLILIGIGVTPEIELAKNIGVSYERGIIVDENYETSLKNIFAIGDCALNKSEYGIVVESIHHAQFSASRVSSYILGQSKIKYEEPWFWSDQFDVKFQSVGLYRPNSETIFRKGKREGSKSWWSFNNQKLVCVEAINDVQNFSFAKRIFENKISVNKNQIEDRNFDLKSLIT
ncbi:FAD-dependent oxidoreductase, partial [SAR116 cluster bacterium]|nr:FAD-dependent oxidoreductase [SAR116 cluster bacterium]